MEIEVVATKRRRLDGLHCMEMEVVEKEKEQIGRIALGSNEKALPSLIYDAKTDNFVMNEGESLVNSILAGQYGKSSETDADSVFFHFEQNDSPTSTLDIPSEKFNIDEVFESFGAGNDHDQKV